MRKLASIVVILLLLPSNASAVQKPIPGKSCNKLAEVKISGSLKYTCINSGGKKVWSKGTPLKVNPSDSSSASKPSTSLSKLESVWSDLNGIRKTYAIPKLLLDIRYSPTINKTYADNVLSGIIAAAQFWQEQYSPKTSLPIIVFTEKDQDWYENQLLGIGVGSENVKNKVEQFASEALRTSTRMNWAGMNGYQDTKWMEFSLGTDFGTSRLGSDAKLFELGNLKTGPHEYTHAAQFQVIGNPNLNFVPCWFLEGGADFYGMIFGAKDLETLKQMRYQQVWEPEFINFNGMAYEPAQGWEAFLEANGEFSDGSKLSKECGPNGAYPVGSLATQYLYELKGQKGIIAFMNGIRETKDWRKSLQNVYGISWVKMKKEVAAYIRLVVAQTPK